MTTETLWFEYQNQIRGFIRNKINDSDTVEDILQNVFIKIHTEVGKLKSTEKLKICIKMLKVSAFGCIFKIL